MSIFTVLTIFLLNAAAFDFDVEDEYLREWMAITRITAGASSQFIPGDINILLVFPGIGFQEDRTRIVLNNLKILQLSKPPQLSCLIFAYHIPPIYFRKEVEDFCTIELYMYANFAYYMKSVVPSLLVTSGYTHVMILLDDIQLPYTFRLGELMNVMIRNNLSVISPTIIGATYPATTCVFCRPRLRTDKGKVTKVSALHTGHKTQVIEIFATLFTLSAWSCWWNLLQPSLNSVGWGYDRCMYNFCKQYDSDFSMGIATGIVAVHGSDRLFYSLSSGAPPSDPQAEVQRWLNVTKHESLMGDENYIGDFLF